MSACNKVVYMTRSRAKRAARTINGAGGNRMLTMGYFTPLRPYLCKTCGLYHLTKSERRRIR